MRESGVHVWRINYDGTANGFCETLKNAQDHSSFVSSLTSSILDYFEGGADRQKVLEYVQKKQFGQRFP